MVQVSGVTSNPEILGFLSKRVWAPARPEGHDSAQSPVTAASGYTLGVLPGGAAGQGCGIATAEVRVQSLTPELLHTAGMTKKKKEGVTIWVVMPKVTFFSAPWGKQNMPGAGRKFPSSGNGGLCLLRPRFKPAFAVNSDMPVF